LKYADNDAVAFVDYLDNATSISQDNIKLLTNEAAKTGNIILELANLAKYAEPEDKIAIYFSGHGDVETLTSAQKGYLLTYNSDPSVYIGSALSIDILNQFIDDMTDTGAQVILVTDACKAGNLAGGKAGIGQASSVLSSRISNEIRLLSCQS
jgi:uncharacterized caspase-like protein